MSYAYLFKYIIIGDTGEQCETVSIERERNRAASAWGRPQRVPMWDLTAVGDFLQTSSTKMALSGPHFVVVEVIFSLAD